MVYRPFKVWVAQLERREKGPTDKSFIKDLINKYGFEATVSECKLYIHPNLRTLGQPHASWFPNVRIISSFNIFFQVYLKISVSFLKLRLQVGGQLWQARHKLKFNINLETVKETKQKTLIHQMYKVLYRYVSNFVLTRVSSEHFRLDIHFRKRISLGNSSYICR